MSKQTTYQIIDSVGLIRGEYDKLKDAEKAIRKLGRQIPHGVFDIRETDSKDCPDWTDLGQEGK